MPRCLRTGASWVWNIAGTSSDVYNWSGPDIADGKQYRILTIFSGFLTPQNLYSV
jgi:hypothetical protein